MRSALEPLRALVEQGSRVDDQGRLALRDPRRVFEVEQRAIAVRLERGVVESPADISEQGAQALGDRGTHRYLEFRRAQLRNLSLP
jgi:hypothetical protein